MNSDKMSTIKMIFFDIDGVLTDGNIYIDESGKESKRFRLTEIDALNSICNIGIQLVAITGEDTPIVDVFRKKINWTKFITGCKDKKNQVIKVQQEFQLDKTELCYIGDGKYDIESIEYVGVGICPNNAIDDAKDVADIVLAGCGGESCVYELYKMIREGRYEETIREQNR